MITEELKRIYASAPAGQAYYETLEITHPLLTPSARWVAHFDQFQALDETGADITFEPWPFTVSLPAASKQAGGELQITAYNGSEGVEAALDLLQTRPDQPMEVKLRIYTEAGQAPAITPILQMTATDITLSFQTVILTCQKYDVLGRSFPQEVYDYERFPGLYR